MISAFLVEDNPTIRENLTSTLDELTHVRVIGHGDGEAVCKTWLTDPHNDWHLAIVDLFLKQGSGLGVLMALRERQPHQKVLVLSNYATQDMRRRCLEMGADAVFDKSNEIDALIEYCQSLNEEPQRQRA